MREQPQKMTEAEWTALGAELFGADKTKWRFVCPHCKHAISIVEARKLPEDQLRSLREGDWRIEQECVGRHISSIGCDWAAFGLFSGPFFVARDGGTETPVFGFAMPEAA
jgi:hypothetical protein